MKSVFLKWSFLYNNFYWHFIKYWIDVSNQWKFSR